MGEAAKFPWAQVLTNFLWILGAAIILATLSWHEFRRAERGGWREVIKDSGFRKAIYFGLVLTMAGISSSINSIWISLITGLMAAGCLILFIKESTRRSS